MAKSKIILLDSDVISHFMSTAKIDLLPRILSPHNLFIVADVYRESVHHPLFDDRKKELDGWIARHKIQKIDFPWNNISSTYIFPFPPSQIKKLANVSANQFSDIRLHPSDIRPLPSHFA